MLVVEIVAVLALLALVQPLVHRRLLERRRTAAIRGLERRRGSRVITLIHRQEAFAFLGVPFGRYLDIEDSEAVLRAIELTAADVPIDMILHTPGGLALAAEQIATALSAHPAPVTVFVPHYAMSGGTIIALAADEVVMAPSAVLGTVEPEIADLPAVSILAAVSAKDPKDIDDETLILADVAAKSIRQIRELVAQLAARRLPAGAAQMLATTLTEGRWTHDFPISAELAASLGLDVSIDLPDEVRRLMDLYGQPPGRRPSVHYVPIPYVRGQPTSAPERRSPAGPTPTRTARWRRR